MDQPPSNYDTDVLVWYERQAAILRDLGASGLPLPNELDLQNIVEEIESVGRSELASVQSYLRLVLLHLIKLAASPDALSAEHWLDEISTFHGNIFSHLTPSMRQRSDVDLLWRRAGQDTRTRRVVRADPKLTLPSACPIALDDLLAEDLDLDAALAKMRMAMAPPA
jgi:hypothetical protein